MDFRLLVAIARLAGHQSSIEVIPLLRSGSIFIRTPHTWGFLPRADIIKGVGFEREFACLVELRGCGDEMTIGCCFLSCGLQQHWTP